VATGNVSLPQFTPAAPPAAYLKWAIPPWAKFVTLYEGVGRWSVTPATAWASRVIGAVVLDLSRPEYRALKWLYTEFEPFLGPDLSGVTFAELPVASLAPRSQSQGAGLEIVNRLRNYNNDATRAGNVVGALLPGNWNVNDAPGLPLQANGAGTLDKWWKAVVLANGAIRGPWLDVSRFTNLYAVAWAQRETVAAITARVCIEQTAYPDILVGAPAGSEPAGGVSSFGASDIGTSPNPNGNVGGAAATDLIELTADYGAAVPLVQSAVPFTDTGKMSMVRSPSVVRRVYQFARMVIMPDALTASMTAGGRLYGWCA
jgi:hypothetical protein